MQKGRVETLKSMRKLALLLALCAFAASACSSAGDDSLAEMTVKALSGSVDVQRDDATIAVSGDETIEAGDVIITGDGSSRAQIRLAGDRLAELAPHTRVEVLDGSTLRGLDGALLGDVGDHTVVRFGRATATSNEGLFRIDLGAGSARAGVYRGALSLETPGQADRRVDALFQSTVSGYARALAPVPLGISEGDRWDRLELSSVFELDDRLETLGAGVSSQLAGARPGLDFFSPLVARDAGAVRRYLHRRVSDLLIGFTIARNSRGSFRTSLRSAFGLFDEGGRWGIVARIMHAGADPVVAQLRSIVRSTGLFAAGGRPSFTVAQVPGSATTSSPSATGTGGDIAPPPSGGDEPGGGGNPSPQPSPSPSPDECDPLQDPGCAIGGILPSPSPPGILDGTLGD